MRILIIAMLLLVIIGTLTAQDARIISTRNGKTVSIAQLAKQLKKYDVVFFGEFHDDSTLHALQAELLPLMHKAGKRLIVSFEMFERDVQPDLDAYLAGSVTEEQFLQSSRPWSNYGTDYRPLLEFARLKNLKAIAANIPRRLAGQVARNGTAALDDLSNDDKVLMALEISAPEGKYKERFMATMKANGMHASPNDANMLERLYYAQCMKDDTMAESLAQYLERYPRHRIVHYNGDFHSREYLGTVERLRSRVPKARIAVLSPHYASLPLPETPSELADYLIVIPEKPEQNQED